MTDEFYGVPFTSEEQWAGLLAESPDPAKVIVAFLDQDQKYPPHYENYVDYQKVASLLDHIRWCVQAAHFKTRIEALATGISKSGVKISTEDIEGYIDTLESDLDKGYDRIQEMALNLFEKEQ